MKVTILGTDNSGLAIVNLLAKHNLEITIFTDNNEEQDNLLINSNNMITTDFKEAILKADLIILNVSLTNLEELTIDMAKYFHKKSHICIIVNGIGNKSEVFPYRIVKKILKTNNVGVVSGSLLARDLDKPNGLVVASKNRQTLAIMKKVFSKEWQNIKDTDDIIGVSLLGSLKDIMAIGLGIMDGLHYGKIGKSMFFTKFFSDIIRIIYEFGGDTFSILTYAGIGELYLVGNDSRNKNYVLGRMLGNNNSRNEIEDYLDNNTIEGAIAISSLYEIFKKKRINIFIIDALFAIVYKNDSLDLIDDYLMEKSHDLKI